VADRSRGFAQLLRLVADAAAPEPVHAGTHQDRIYSLAALGVPRSAGLSRRPVLLGGLETERLLKQLEDVSRQRAAGTSTRAVVNNPAYSGWAQYFVPRHVPGRVLQWERWGGRVSTSAARCVKRPRLPKARVGGCEDAKRPRGPSPTGRTSALVPSRASRRRLRSTEPLPQRGDGATLNLQGEAVPPPKKHRHGRAAPSGPDL
jgi:hypothetical protein